MIHIPSYLRKINQIQFINKNISFLSIWGFNWERERPARGGERSGERSSKGKCPHNNQSKKHSFHFSSHPRESCRRWRISHSEEHTATLEPLNYPTANWDKIYSFKPRKTLLQRERERERPPCVVSVAGFKWLCSRVCRERFCVISPRL